MGRCWQHSIFFTIPNSLLTRRCSRRPKDGDWPAARLCQEGAGEYEAQRDFPSIEGTSRLSACLAVGVLSPRQCLYRLLAEQPEALNGGAGSVSLNELIWREFYRHLMTNFPRLCKHRPFIGWTDRVRWREPSDALLSGLAGGAYRLPDC
ncbi:hypothetical protein ACLK1Y_03905 [Escherichia coli]